MLTAKSARVRQARKLTRRAGREKAALFLAEGAQAVREAVRAGSGRVVELFATPAALERHPDIAADAARAGLEIHIADDAALASLSETVTPQGLVAVCQTLAVSLDDALPLAPLTPSPGKPSQVTPPSAQPSSSETRAAQAAPSEQQVTTCGPYSDPEPGRPVLVAVMVEARDPGNAGTVIRCADAAGADAVVLTEGSVDPEGGKAVRASAGSLFHLPVATDAPPIVVAEHLHRAGLTILAADGGGEQDLDDAESAGLLARPTAWLFGNEAWGLPDDVRTLADHVVRVPIYGHAESLNLATAAAVCLYASARDQRRG